jgi:hypothetical protein
LVYEDDDGLIFRRASTSAGAAAVELAGGPSERRTASLRHSHRLNRRAGTSPPASRR